ncbi:putative aldouronate transport system permease protein [Lachnospiraceae bacterium XBB2008]|nr:putative aldouronate transport system permease protein [Lachnospiraceae bacterium XBB2008]
MKLTGNTSGSVLKSRDRSLVAISLPTIMWYLAFCYLPMFGMVIAFKRYRMVPGRGFIYSLFRGSEWVGIDNFRFLFLNPQMSLVIRNTIFYNLVFLLLDIVLPIGLSVGLSLISSNRFRAVSQAVSLLPYFLSWVVVSSLTYAFLSTDRGLINHALAHIGITPIAWYRTPAVWPWILILTHLWKSVGYFMVLYLSYISSIDKSLYDSAMMDGAATSQMIRYITLPHLKGIASVMVILSLGHILSTDFGLFYQVTRDSGSILSATETVDVYIYRALINNSDYGFSAAAGLLQNGIGCVLLLIVNYILNRMDPDNGLV